MPWRFDQKLYDETIERVINIFKHAEKEDYDVDGPEMVWECGFCSIVVREKCGRNEYMCKYPKCYKKMYEYPDSMTSKFKALPMCENHFRVNNPHSKYEKFKYEEYEK